MWQGGSRRNPPCQDNHGCTLSLSDCQYCRRHEFEISVVSVCSDFCRCHGGIFCRQCISRPEIKTNHAGGSTEKQGIGPIPSASGGGILRHGQVSETSAYPYATMKSRLPLKIKLCPPPSLLSWYSPLHVPA